MGGRLSTEALALAVFSLVLVLFGIVVVITGLNAYSDTARGVTSVSGVAKITEITNNVVYDSIKTPYPDSSNTLYMRESLAVYLPSGDYSIVYDKSSNKFYIESLVSLSEGSNKTKKVTQYFGIRDEYLIRESVYVGNDKKIRSCQYKVYFESLDNNGEPVTVHFTVDTPAEYTVIVTVERRLTELNDNTCSGYIRISYSFLSTDGHVIKYTG